MDAQAQQMQIIAAANGGRTAHVSAVPRANKIKVSGGTQTCTADLQTKCPAPNAQHRSFSLTGTNAAQLSQSIRERLSSGSHSLPKPGTDLSVFQHRLVLIFQRIDFLTLCHFITKTNKKNCHSY